MERDENYTLVLEDISAHGGKVQDYTQQSQAGMMCFK